MQNPFRHRPEGDFGREDRDAPRWEAADRRRDEDRSWTEGDGGRTAEAWRGQGRPDDRRDYDRDRYARTESRGRYDRDYGGEPTWGSQDRRTPDYGSQTYSRHAYAPGSQIWEDQRSSMTSREMSSRPQHDFEPDYLHWRDQQLANFDRDYSEWRSERREKFSSDFDSWRQNRPHTGKTHTPAENPIVGDITDGGDGRGGEAAARKR